MAKHAQPCQDNKPSVKRTQSFSKGKTIFQSVELDKNLEKQLKKALKNLSKVNSNTTEK
jgi:hypothetical protein